MPSRKFPRRPETPSSAASKKDALFEELLALLSQGGEPLPTEEEYRRWRIGWYAAHPGRFVDGPNGSHQWEAPQPASEDMPWRIQRHAALEEIRVLDWKIIKRAWKAMREEPELSVANGQPGSPKSWIGTARTEEELRERWETYRRNLISRYRLDGLLPPESTTWEIPLCGPVETPFPLGGARRSSYTLFDCEGRD